jgi:hypothetical protein
VIFDPSAAPWRKSSYSHGSNTDCVEVAPTTVVVGVRDTKSRERGHVTVGRTAWAAFARAAARGDLAR